MTSTKTGTFYGVGVGPGDPELLTLKALSVLREVKVIAVPRSADPDGSSQALSIVRKAVGLEDKEVMEFLFPMTKDKNLLNGSRKEAADRVSRRLGEGSDVAFITLGDPMLYSTFSYLVPLVRSRLEGAKIKVVPGITSFSASASSACIPLAESNEKVIIIPAAYDMEDIKNALASFDTVVLMKVNKAIDGIVDLLCEEGLEDSSVFISRAGWPEEEVMAGGLRGLKGRRLDYFSMVIVKKGMQQIWPGL